MKLSNQENFVCDEGVLNAVDLKATEKQILDFQAKIDGLLTSSSRRVYKRSVIHQKP
ncbi:MAG: hypothetical protein KAI83_19505 [Thiomargarita sp.]|nr:hypothetical protein [Thiomargarita sp.]